MWARLEDLFPCTPSPHAGTGKVGRVGLRPTAPLDRSAREPGVKQGDGPVSLQLTLNGSPLPALKRGRLHMGTVTHAEAWTVPQTKRTVPQLHALPPVSRRECNRNEVMDYGIHRTVFSRTHAEAAVYGIG